MSTAPAPGTGWLRQMRPREADEAHRAASPLELLFDLVFVVAVAFAAAELAHALEENHVGQGVLGFAMVFFAVWWAWMNFTWFASAYDIDDVPYRLLTLLQMAGVLILAAGVPAALGERDFTAVTVGYLVMRLGLVAQWLRAAAADPPHRRAAMTYAVGIVVVQAGWLLRLLLPEALGLAAFGVLVVAELAVPMVAERRRMTTWHPHHIAERYGLFTIIVLGECVLASTVAVQGSLEEDGVTDALVGVAFTGLVILFAVWWVYFLKPAGAGLERRRDMSFVWGYGHFFVFASIAALGAGLEVTIASLGHHAELATTTVALSVAVPLAVFLVVVWALHAALEVTSARAGRLFVGAAGVEVLLALATGAGLSLLAAVMLMALPLVVVVAVGVRVEGRRPPL